MSQELEPEVNDTTRRNHMEASRKLVYEMLDAAQTSRKTSLSPSRYNPWARSFSDQQPVLQQQKPERPHYKQEQPQLQGQLKPNPVKPNPDHTIQPSTLAPELRQPAIPRIRISSTNPYFSERDNCKQKEPERSTLGNALYLRKTQEHEQQQAVAAGALGLADWGGSLGTRIATHKMFAASMPEISLPNSGSLTWAKNSYRKALQPYLEATLIQLSERGITPATSLAPDQWLKSLQQWRQANMLTSEQADLVNQLQKLENCVYKTLPAEIRNDQNVRQAAQELAFHQSQYEQALLQQEEELAQTAQVARRARHTQIALQGSSYLANLGIDLGFFNKTPVSLRTTLADLASPLLIYGKFLPAWGKFASITSLHLLNRCLDQAETKNTEPPF